MRFLLAIVTLVAIPITIVIVLFQYAGEESSAAPLHGAIFTTTPDGGIVNENVRYEQKIHVYLDGGPPPNAPQTAAGLPDGLYVFQVTDPSGKVLLSEDPARCRIVEVAEGVIVALLDKTPTGFVPHDVEIDDDCHVNDPDGEAGATGRHDTNTDVDPDPPPIRPAIVVQLMPFFDTPNPGGVYKAWVVPLRRYLVPNGGVLDADPEPLCTRRGRPSKNCNGNAVQIGFERDPGFGPPRDQVKTDNFKVNEFFPPEITVRKFHDVNGDGVWQTETEPEIGLEQCVKADGTLADCDEGGGWPYDFTEPVDGGTVTNGFFTPGTHVAGIPGTYNATEIVLPGWTQSAAYLDDVFLGVTPSVDVVVAGTSGEQHEVVFGNFLPGELNIVKETEGVNAPPGVTFTVTPNPYLGLLPVLVPPGCDDASLVLTVMDGDACDRHDGADGTITLVNVPTGSYSVDEPTPPPGTAFLGCQPVPAPVPVGETATVTCTNALADLTIEKRTDGTLTPGLTFTVDPNPYVAVARLDPVLVPAGCDPGPTVLTVTDGSTCDADGLRNGVVVLDNILEGVYLVDEIEPPGTFFAGCAPNPVTVPAGGSGSTTCTNELAELTIEKLTDGSITPGVTFTVTPNPYKAVAALDSALVPRGCDSVSAKLTVTDGDDCDRHDDADGIVTLVNILEGEYRVDEPIPPRGTRFLGCDPNPVSVPAGGSGSTTCTNERLPTRTPGFWQTHTEVTKDAFDAIGPIDLGYITLTSYEDVFGIFYANNHFFEDESERDSVCQARIIGSFQLLAAIINAEWLGTPVPTDPVTGLDLITATQGAMAAGDGHEILRLSELLDDYNNSGTDRDLGFDHGPATPQASQALADDPTDPANCGGDSQSGESSLTDTAEPSGSDPVPPDSREGHTPPAPEESDPTNGDGGSDPVPPDSGEGDTSTAPDESDPTSGDGGSPSGDTEADVAEPVTGAIEGTD